jgi:hypothetical protein
VLELLDSVTRLYRTAVRKKAVLIFREQVAIGDYLQWSTEASIGSWNYLISGFPRVEQIDIVEINPAYLQLMDDYPKQKGAMNDPRIRLHIGDVREFLRTIPEGTYDSVVISRYHRS